MSERSTLSETGSTVAPAPGPAPRRGTTSHARDIGKGFLVKLVLVMLVDALGVYGVITASTIGHWPIVISLVVGLAVVNWVYFSRRMVPLKYLLPGLLFLLVYQVFVMGYTGYVAFTNYGTGHMLTKEQAIERLQQYNQVRVPDSPTYPLTVLERDGEIYFGIVDEGKALVGSADQPLQEVPGAELVQAGETTQRIASAPGYQTIDFAGLLNLDQDVSEIRVPWSDDPTSGSLSTDFGANGFRNQPALVYDADEDTMTHVETGAIYYAEDSGSFTAADGTTLTPGWRVAVGFDNFTRMFTEERLSGPFLKAATWTFAFAFLSVATTFALGLFIAITFNDERVRGRKIYRSLLILPYAFPGFLSALIWAGMLNRSYGFINQTLLGGASIDWLGDPWLAKIAIIGVNLWLGFPYMFLITTGALQSIPSDINEAARIDGAGPFRVFRSLTLPLLLVSVTPLLIASFAFNFNNFSLIYMLTKGGPVYVGNEYGLGSTDILISTVYKIAIEGGGAKDYGLASAMSIIIFLVVGLVSYIGFRKTRSLEEIN